MPFPQEDLRHAAGHIASADRIAYARLLQKVLGVTAPTVGPWRSFALFAPEGTCAAALEVAILPLLLDNMRGDAGTIRSVAVDPAWRGRGLFRRLMDEALAWCDARTSGPVFLYAEEPALYERFGFRHVAQHAFVGTAPAPVPCARARDLDLGDAADIAAIRAGATDRTAISVHVALCVDPDLILTNLAKDEGWRVASLPAHDALIVYEEEAGEIVVADVIAARIPALAILLGAFEPHARVKTLFPPDRLGWCGTPTLEDTGLMIRGATPAALERPFMFPPTAEF